MTELQNANPNENANDEQPSKRKRFEPDQQTIWLLEDVEGIEAFAARWLGEQYRGKIALARIVKRLDTSRLNDRKTVVCVVLDSREPYTKPEVGRPSPNFVLSEPIACAKFYQEGADGFGSIQVRNLINENTGRTIPGLCDVIGKACFQPDELGIPRPTVRAIYRDDDHSLRITRD